MNVHGVSLHYFNEAANNDKFYRTFIYEVTDGWNVSYHWGRDGAPHGQVKTEHFRTKQGVQMALDKKVNEKLSKGYEYLGQGDITVMDISTLSDVSSVGNLLHARVGRDPIKLPSGFSLIIKEEDDIMEMIKI